MLATYLATALVLVAGSAVAEYDKPVHGFAIHGEPKYGPGFTHFDYVNPDAPKGGKLVIRGRSQTFDSLNPFILKGLPASGLYRLHQHDYLPAIVPVIFESLLIGSLDEPFTMYGLIAETIEVPEDRSYVKFQLRREAKFQDGTPITVDDVIFSFNILVNEGEPLYRAYFGDVASVDKTGEREVTFTFKAAGNNELPLILGEMPILSQAYWDDKDFTEAGLVGPLGSGPYRIKDFEPGRFIEYERAEDYWGAGLPVNIGRHNLDAIRYDYYRDETVAFEAFLAGEYDLRYENSARNWAIGYDGDDLDDGLIVKEAFPDFTPAGMQGFIYNTRLPKFSDKRLRKALAYAFDVPWTNKTIFYDQYKRSRSYYESSELAATGLPQGRELEILEQYRDELPDEVFSKEYNPPTTDGSGNIRANLLLARTLLEEAGWTQTETGLVNKDGEVLEFEILLRSPTFERITGPLIQNLERLGVQATMRTIDASQWVNRVQAHDYDVMVFPWGQTLSPGNEQREYWGSASADQEGSMNFAGIKDPVADEVIEQLILANTRDELIAHTRALDRILQWGHYVIPNWHSPDIRVASWNKFSHPEAVPLRGIAISTWWYDEQKAANLEAGQTQSPTQEDKSEDDAQQPDNAPWMILIAVVGVVLLLWSFVRRRNR
ncbi:MAG: ABC transporter substrate-binding protein [Alphaproteobacteria bacterium]|nr:ABC transporter substrate-binding protein [Alphaproteobacteria bacterium]